MATPNDEGQQYPEDEERRARGVSPVVEGRNRNKLGMVAGALVILLVVGFLFVSGAKSSKPQAATKAPAIANSPGLPPAAPAPPPLPPLTPEEAAAGFPPPPVPGQNRTPQSGEAAESARQKEEARLRSPMLIYDGSGHEDQTPPAKSPAPDALTSLLATHLQSANAATSSDQQRQDRSTPAEGYAERTQAFAKAASDKQAEVAAAHRISMNDRIAEGKMLAATLETAISSDLPGKLRAVVTSDVWSEDGGRRLIRRGSRLIGEYRSGLVRGQTRVFVIWTRLLEPDGTDVAIGSPGTDDIGRAGLTGTIDRHFVERFGAAFLLSLIGSATTASQGGNTFVINTSQGFGQVAQGSLQDSINIPPTVYVDQGAQVQVFVARDLVFDPISATAQR
ncbi:MAG: TrbI/VirB10 family protein [Nevskia sp.]|nr:TrbI/VirB10 family protein [Nevskia sp.]